MRPDEMPRAAEQATVHPWRDRLPLPPLDAMDAQQRAAAQVLIDGPRKGVYGPFLPLMRSPQLLDRVAKVGEYLRFESVLEPRVRELATCAVARHVGNAFEWQMHAPLAVKAGVDERAVEAMRQGARPQPLRDDEQLALDFAECLLTKHGVAQLTWDAAVARFGDRGVVELATLVGYFAMVSWLMNAAHTPATGSDDAKPLPVLPL
jgi:4-carboxymuconolactone decarboxylase